MLWKLLKKIPYFLNPSKTTYFVLHNYVDYYFNKSKTTFNSFDTKM